MDVIDGKDDRHTFLIGIGLSDEEARMLEQKTAGDRSVTEVAREIARQKGITISHAYREARRQQLAHTSPAPDGWSKRDYVLEALYRLNSNSGVRADTLASALKAMSVNINLQALISILWDLQKQEQVAFSESHAKGGSILSRIRLTPKGRAAIVEKRGTPQDASIRVNAKTPKESGLSSSTRRGAVHAVGVDKTYYRNHRKVAEGGPIEIVKPGKPEPEVIPTPVIAEAQPEPYVDPNPLPQNMKAPLDITELAFPRLVRDIDLTQYPLLVDLVARRNTKKEMRDKAAKFVEAASLIVDLNAEEADRLMTMAGEMEGTPLTRLELEMLRLIDSFNLDARD